MRIRVSGEIGGMIIVAMVGLICAGILTWLIGLIGKYIVKDNSTGKKIIGIIEAIIWIAAIVLIVLDLTGIAPIIRNVLFSIL